MTHSILFWILATCLLVTALPAEAQQPGKVPRMGFLSPFSPSATAIWLQAFRQGLHDLGWVEGKNISVEYRYAEGRNDRLPDLAADLVRLKVDIIVTAVTPDALAAKNATRTIPIVMAAAGDPVASGLVDSLARPGGNITGLTSISVEMEGKRLELLREVVPKVSHIAVLWNAASPIQVIEEGEVRAAAGVLGIKMLSLGVRTREEIDDALATIIGERPDALLVLADRLFLHHRTRIMDFAAQERLPGVHAYRELVEAGGLMSYGPSYADMHRRAAAYVDKILKGAKPADLPVERPVKFELVVNLKAAKALGLTIPPSVIFRADEIIE